MLQMFPFFKNNSHITNNTNKLGMSLKKIICSIFYRQQHSRGKVKCLHLSASHSIHRAVSGRHPPGRHPPPWADTTQTDTPWANTPPRQTPP